MKWLRDVFRGFMTMVWSTWRGGKRVLVVTPDYYMRGAGNQRDPAVVRCRVFVRGVVKEGVDMVFTHRVEKTGKGSDIEAVRFADLGVTWCYGWNDEDAKALHALAALDACES